MSARRVDVWYICDQTLCNFDCPYCVTQRTRYQAGSRMWQSDESEERFRRILSWLAGLPWRLRVRLQTKGEPFVSREFLAGAAWLSRQDNVEFVELLTNGSYRPEQIERFAQEADIRRISLWITFHVGQISPERVVAAAVKARSLGAFVVVHGLLFPDTMAAIEDLIARCKAEGIRTDVTAGHNYNEAYGSQGFIPIAGTEPQALRLYRHPAVLKAMIQAHKGPLGAPCSAGHDYFFIRTNGDVYPCNSYSHGLHNRLGSALDAGFLPSLRTASPYSPCEHSAQCVCKEDYLHLRTARAAVQMGPSLGYYRPRGLPEPVAPAPSAGGR